jgi:hypothetical protein
MFLSLIRCYCDAERLDKALETIKEMDQLKVDVKLRTFQPILDSYFIRNEPWSLLQSLRSLHHRDIPIYSSHIQMAIECVLKSKDGFSTSVEVSDLEEFLRKSSSDLSGLFTRECESIVATTSGEDDAFNSPLIVWPSTLSIAKNASYCSVLNASDLNTTVDSANFHG